MPSLLDMLQAVPRCGRRRMRREGQHGVHFTCWEPMLYFAASNLYAELNAHTAAMLQGAGERA